MSEVLFWVCGRDDSGRNVVRIYNGVQIADPTVPTASFSEDVYAVDAHLIEVSKDEGAGNQYRLTDQSMPQFKAGQLALAPLARGWPEAGMVVLQVGGDLRLIGAVPYNDDALKICNKVFMENLKGGFFKRSADLERDSAEKTA